MKSSLMNSITLCMGLAALASAQSTTTTTTITLSSGTAVAGARGKLDPVAAAEANPVDTTAVKAFTGVKIKDGTGECLSIDPTAGDFRENLIPIALKACNGDPGQNFDIVTSGKHNNVPGKILIVSSLTQGCLNFDPRRAPGDTVVMFSCGGRADGGGQVTDSQLFPFKAGIRNLPLAPENAKGKTCFVKNGDRLDEAPCSNRPEQLFTIE